MSRFVNAVVLGLVFGIAQGTAQEGKSEKEPVASKATSSKPVSFKKDVFPLIQKYCLPCHAEENFNPSELSMDTYELIAAGGKNGVPFVAGKSKESLVIKKLGEKPPAGDRMPLNPKKKVEEGKAVWMKDTEVKIIADWIDQGAKKN